MKSIFTCTQFKNCSLNKTNWHHHSVITILKWLPIALVFLLMSPAVAFGQGIGSTTLGFETDANFHSNSIPGFWKFSAPNQTYFPSELLGDDWSKGAAGNAVLTQLNGVSVPGLTADRRAIWQVDGNWGSNVPAELSVFDGTSNKNGDAIGAGQSPYKIGTGSGGPQKNDITNVFLHSRRAATTNDLWLFFGAETRSINGSSYLDFEYNQAGVTTSGGFMIGQGPVNGRTIDDILLVVNYTQGGKVPIVGIRKWTASGTWSDELTLSGGTTFMTTNTTNITAVAPLKGYAGDGTPSSTSLAFQFVEGALNVSALGFVGLTACNPAATITIKTRSSASYTSELKDWDVLSFPLTPVAGSTVADITPQCRSLNGINIFNISGTYENGTPAWSTSAGTLSNQSYTNGTATATLTINDPTSSATVTLTTTSANSNCPSGTANKMAVINPNPVVDAIASPAGSVSIISAPPHYALSTDVNGTVNNTGYNYAWVQDPPEGITTGTLSATNIPNPNFTANVAQSFTWTVTATDKVTGCFSSDPVTRVVTPSAACPQVPTAPVCAGSTNTYTADLLAVPANETWVWSVDNGATINTLPVNGGVSISVTAGTQSFTLTLTRTFANTAVPASVCTYPVTVKPNPVGSADPQTNCSGEATNIALNSDLTGTSFTWTAAILTTPTGGTITGHSACASSCGATIAQTLENTGSTIGVVRYTVTPFADGCTGASFTVDATVNPVPSVNQPGDQEICKGTNTTAVNFTGAGVTKFTWTNSNTSIGLAAASGEGDIAAFTGTTGATPSSTTITVTPHFVGGGKDCVGPSKSFTITVNPDAAPPSVTYIPPTCTESTFSVEVTNPAVGSTYTLTQLDGNIVNKGPYVSGTLVFTGLNIGQGYSVISTTAAGCKSNPNQCGTFTPAAGKISKPVTKVIEPIKLQATVVAAPNPFSDRIRFSIKSPESGKGSLDLYNMLGQKVKTIFQGNIEKGMIQTFDYNVPGAQRSNLIYVFRIGDQTISGKLIGLK